MQKLKDDLIIKLLEENEKLKEDKIKIKEHVSELNKKIKKYKENQEEK